MRTTILAILLAASASIALPAMAQDTHAPQQKGVDQHMQNEADKGMKTRNSGESGYVADQDKPGASSHPPGQPKTTTGSSRTGTSDKSR
jgi:hypothetical protein